MRGFRKFGKLGSLFKRYFTLLNKDKSIVTILDENNNALANVAVQIKGVLILMLMLQIVMETLS